MSAFQESIQEMSRTGRWDLPLPGAGETPRRLLMLSQIARRDLSAARIAEGHTAAMAILAEAGRPARENALYAVWSADEPDREVRAARLPEHAGWRLHGIKQGCCGISLVDAALITAQVDDEVLLFELTVDEHVQRHPAEWQAAALANANIGTVSIDATLPAPDCTVGAPDWYLRRAGFWNEAVASAAVWAGGAMSLIDAARELKPTTRAAREQMGALEAAAWQLGAILDQCGREIDEDPGDASNRARARALMVRHLVERTCTEVMERFGRATGDHFLAHDAFVAEQYAALTLCIRQAQIDRELETIPDSL